MKEKKIKTNIFFSFLLHCFFTLSDLALSVFVFFVSARSHVK